MRINGHAHIFNLHSVLTRHAVKIMVNRLRSLNVPDFVSDGVERFLQEQFEKPEYLTETELLARFLDHISRTKTFKDFSKKTAGLPVEIRLLGGGIKTVQVSALRATLDRISSLFDKGASTKTTVLDVFETLRLAAQADVTGVAATILQDMRPDDGLIALMMDITSEQTQAQDEAKFLAQLKGTSDAAIAFPGRVFPFVSVNTRRVNHFEHMKQAIETRGFVGVKVYPSLGFPVDSPAMLRVYDYCVENELPILMHCTLTGFFESEASKLHSHPDRWWPILEERPELRVCFAHTGGLQQNVLTPGGPKQGDWPDIVRQLMLSYPNVFCDLAYHVDQMVSPQMEQFYLRWLREILADERLNDRVMFGTDVWLVRLSLADQLFWHWFEANLTAAEQVMVMEEAPANFLGLPTAGRAARKNIERMMEFLKAQPLVGELPPDWLRTAAAHSWTVLRSVTSWSPGNHAHKVTHTFFRSQMTGSQRELEFANAGGLRLRQLTYWRNAPNDPVFREDCDALAQSLVIFCKNSGGSFEGEYNADAAMDKLATFIADGEKTLAQAGATVDAIFRFSTETTL